MTLITYPTRVHFADGVLEEALRSELEARDLRHPLILSDADELDSDTTERLYSGLPRRAKFHHATIDAENSKYVTAALVEKQTRAQRPDVIIAYGSARAIAHARKCRHVLHRVAAEQDPQTVAAEIFAIPGIDGLPNPCRSSLEPSQTLFDPASRAGLPSIVICDPTVMDGASVDDVTCAATDAFARCVEAYLSDGYNPPADGMALDGFNRAVRSMAASEENQTPEMRRELMAANLNATLAQNKGMGPTQIIADVLREPYGNRYPSGALARILLPVVLSARSIPAERREPLSRMLALAGGASLDEGVEELFSTLPLVDRLSDLGLTHDDLVHASEELEDMNTHTAPASFKGAMSIMEAVF